MRSSVWLESCRMSWFKWLILLEFALVKATVLKP